MFLKFRTLNHKLPIQKGRILGIDRNDRLCGKCNTGDLGDEYHYIFQCPFFSEDRKQFLKPYYNKHPNSIKYKQLFSTSNKNTLLKLIHFIKKNH